MLRRYVFGPGVDEALVWYEGTGTGDRRYLVADERGLIVAVTNASGGASGSGFGINAYDEYGTPGPNNNGRFQYTGQAWLPEAQLYHYKARAYSPALGRFLQPDPIGFGGGMNLYAYVGNDPVNASDPSGLQEVDEIVVTARIVARIDPCGGRAGCISDPQQIRELIDNMGRTRDDFGSSVQEGSGEDAIVVTGQRQPDRPPPPRPTPWALRLGAFLYVFNPDFYQNGAHDECLDTPTCSTGPTLAERLARQRAASAPPDPRQQALDECTNICVDRYARSPFLDPYGRPYYDQASRMRLCIRECMADRGFEY